MAILSTYQPTSGHILFSTNDTWGAPHKAMPERHVTLADLSANTSIYRTLLLWISYLSDTLTEPTNQKQQPRSVYDVTYLKKFAIMLIIKASENERLTLEANCYDRSVSICFW